MLLPSISAIYEANRPMLEQVGINQQEFESMCLDEGTAAMSTGLFTVLSKMDLDDVLPITKPDDIMPFRQISKYVIDNDLGAVFMQSSFGIRVNPERQFQDDAMEKIRKRINYAVRTENAKINESLKQLNPFSAMMEADINLALANGFHVIQVIQVRDELILNTMMQIDEW